MVVHPLVLAFWRKSSKTVGAIQRNYVLKTERKEEKKRKKCLKKPYIWEKPHNLIHEKIRKNKFHHKNR